MTNIWKTIFMGTPKFAEPSLQALLAAKNFPIIGVFTQPDKPVGRKQIITPSAIKVLAQAHKIPVYQPEKIKTEVDIIKSLQPDLIVVVAYGQIIPQAILDIPSLGIINVHASLLPKYRGAACLAAPILNGDLETGITIMKMEATLDTGPILKQAKIKLTGQEYLTELHDKLATLGAEILIPTLIDYAQGKIKPQAQDDNQTTYVKQTNKAEGKIDWQQSANHIERQIRAYNPWPGAYCQLPSGQTLKIIKAQALTGPDSTAPGKIKIDKGSLLVGTGQGNLLILELQAAGQKVMSASDFLRGHKLADQQLL